MLHPDFDRELKKIISHFQLEIGIETGTYQGNMSLYLSKLMKNVYTSEISRQFYDNLDSAFECVKQSDTLKISENIEFHLGSSERILENILPGIKSPYDNDDKPFALFFLDAHWENYWPLLDEIKCIGRLLPDKAIIIIDDCKVPGRKHGFDRYHGKELDFSYVKGALAGAFPNGFGHYYITSSAMEKDGEPGRLVVFPSKFPIPSECTISVSSNL